VDGTTPRRTGLAPGFCPTVRPSDCPTFFRASSTSASSTVRSIIAQRSSSSSTTSRGLPLRRTCGSLSASSASRRTASAGGRRWAAARTKWARPSVRLSGSPPTPTSSTARSTSPAPPPNSPRSAPAPPRRETLHDRVRADAPKVEALQPRENRRRRLGDLERLRRGEDEHDPRRRLLEDFEEGIPRLAGEHVRFVHDVHLVAVLDAGRVHRALAQVARVIDAAIGG